MMRTPGSINQLGKRVSERLACIVGLPLWDCGRAADLLWLHFGNRRVATTRGGTIREVGDYALHIQCAWRIICRRRVVSASDLEPSERIDAELLAFVREHCPAIVERVEGDDHGGLLISLAGGCLLEVSPYDDSDEQWRLLQPGTSAPHLVLDGTELRESGP